MLDRIPCQKKQLITKHQVVAIGPAYNQCFILHSYQQHMNATRLYSATPEGHQHAPRTRQENKFETSEPASRRVQTNSIVKPHKGTHARAQAKGNASTYAQAQYPKHSSTCNDEVHSTMYHTLASYLRRKFPPLNLSSRPSCAIIVTP